MTTAVRERLYLDIVIAGAGLLVGTLDIADALIFYGLRGTPPIRILQGIAYALIGRNAYSLGIRSAALGLMLHFLIATATAAVYIHLSQRFPLSRHPWISGTLYGIAVYIFMNYIVLSLSHIGLRPLPPLIPFINGVAALIFCIGIPLAFIARKYVPSRAI